MEIPRNVISYWVDLCADALHSNPSHTLLQLYESLNGFYLKKLRVEKSPEQKLSMNRGRWMGKSWYNKHKNIREEKK